MLSWSSTLRLISFRWSSPRKDSLSTWSKTETLIVWGFSEIQIFFKVPRKSDQILSRAQLFEFQKKWIFLQIKTNILTISFQIEEEWILNTKCEAKIRFLYKNIGKQSSDFASKSVFIYPGTVLLDTGFLKAWKDVISHKNANFS